MYRKCQVCGETFDWSEDRNVCFACMSNNDQQLFEKRIARIEAAALAAFSGLISSRYNKDHIDGELSLNGLSIRMGKLFVDNFDNWKDQESCTLITELREKKS